MRRLRGESENEDNAYARSMRMKSPLTDLVSVKQAVVSLQKEARQQIQQEGEMQSAMESLIKEVNHLKQAFTTLNDTVREEIRVYKKETSTRLDMLEEQISNHIRVYNEHQKDMDIMKRSLSIWDVKERDWQKDIEILKVGHEHMNEWLQRSQHYSAETQGEFKTFKNDVNVLTTNILAESTSLRNQWDRQVEALQSKLASYDRIVEQHSKDLLLQDSQRMDDLELLEQALSTVQAQQMRLRASVEESIAACRSDTSTASNKIDRLESPLIASKMEITELRRDINQKEKESRQRFESIAAVLRVFAESLHITPPTFVERCLS